MASKQSSRAIAVLSSEQEIRSANKSLTETASKTVALLRQGADDSDFSLKTQRAWQTLAQKYNVKLDLFNWIDASEVTRMTISDTGLIVREARISARLTGRLIDLSLFNIDLFRQQGISLIKLEAISPGGLDYANSNVMNVEYRVIFRVKSS